MVELILCQCYWRPYWVLLLYLKANQIYWLKIAPHTPLTQVKKIKAVFHVMNKFNLDMTQRCFIAECWCPEEDLEEIQQALNRGVVRSSVVLN